MILCSMLLHEYLVYIHLTNNYVKIDWLHNLHLYALFHINSKDGQIKFKFN